MKKIIVSLAVLLALGSAASGCNRKAGLDTAVVEGVNTLPGATNVWAAVDRKDYDGAMAALFKVQQACTTADQSREFTVLAFELRKKLSEVAPTNQKAAEAVNTLRSMGAAAR